MRDAPCVTSQQTFYKTYYNLPVSMFTCVKRQPVVIYNTSNMKNIIFSAKFTLTPQGVTGGCNLFGFPESI